jgi:hypothetical protein
MSRAKKNEEEEALKQPLMTPAPPAAQAPLSAPPAPQVAPAPASVPAPVDDRPVVETIQQPALTQTSNSTTASATQGAKATKNEAPLLQEQDKIFARQQEQAAKAAEAGRNKAIADAAQADEKARITSEKAAQTDAIVKDGEKLLSDRLAESERVYGELKSKADIKDYWESQSTGNKILAGLGIALGGIGAGMAGQSSNRALDVINKAIEQDFARQKANFENARAMASESREQTQAARQNLADRANMLNLSKAAAYDTLADKYAAMAAKRGVLGEADLAKDAVLFDLRAKQNQAKLEYEKGLRQSVTSSTQRQVTQALDPSSSDKPTEGQGKARGFVTRMVSATKNYDKVGGLSPEGADAIRKHMIENFIEMKDASGALKWVIKPGAKPLPSNLSEKDRLAWSAVEDFSRANLRKESGAVIGRDEFMDELNQIIPTAGDTPKTIAAKRKLMSQQLAAAAQEVGRARVNLPPEPSQTSSRTLVKKQFNAGLNQTKFVYDDGSEEIVDGQK